MKRVDKLDSEEEREPENLKKKRKRIKQLQSDSSDEEGKKMFKHPSMLFRGLILTMLLSKAVGQRSGE